MTCLDDGICAKTAVEMSRSIRAADTLLTSFVRIKDPLCEVHLSRLAHPERTHNYPQILGEGHVSFEVGPESTTKVCGQCCEPVKRENQSTQKCINEEVSSDGLFQLRSAEVLHSSELLSCGCGGSQGLSAVPACRLKSARHVTRALAFPSGLEQRLMLRKECLPT